MLETFFQKCNQISVGLSSDSWGYSCRSRVAPPTAVDVWLDRNPPGIDYQLIIGRRKRQLVCLWVAEEYICTFCELSSANSAVSLPSHKISQVLSSPALLRRPLLSQPPPRRVAPPEVLLHTREEIWINICRVNWKPVSRSVLRQEDVPWAATSRGAWAPAKSA